jgi:signal peptidase I
MIFSHRNIRKPWLAFALSILSPGLGHMYNGNLNLAVIFRISMYLYFLIATFAGFLSKFWFFFIVFLILRIFHVYIAIDSFIKSKKNLNFIPKQYTFFLMYFLFFLIFSGLDFVVYKKLSPTGTFRMKASSMLPTISNNDLIMADKSYFRKNKIQHGNIVLYKHNNKTWLHRIIGLPGDTISLHGDTVYLNNILLKEPYTRFDSGSYLPPNYPKLKEELVIPENQIFVMGDNRNKAFDSRYWGFLPMIDIRGKALYIYISKDISKIGNNL